MNTPTNSPRDFIWLTLCAAVTCVIFALGSIVSGFGFYGIVFSGLAAFCLLLSYLCSRAPENPKNKVKRTFN